MQRASTISDVYRGKQDALEMFRAARYKNVAIVGAAWVDGHWYDALHPLWPPLQPDLQQQPLPLPQPLLLLLLLRAALTL